MGFLNNTTVTVDAILTKKGRELLAQGTDAFNITKFALADDEIDYNLFDVTHPNGSDSYGKVIENMPLLEAIPDENHTMRYKLITLPKSTIKMPVIAASVDSITFNASAGLQQPAQIVTAVTANVADSSYTFILHDQSVCTMNVNEGAGGGVGGAGSAGVVILRFPSTYTATLSGGVSSSSATVGTDTVLTITATSSSSETVTFS